VLVDQVQQAVVLQTQKDQTALIVFFQPLLLLAAVAQGEIQLLGQLLLLQTAITGVLAVEQEMAEQAEQETHLL
jgi:hypothetical protein